MKARFLENKEYKPSYGDPPEGNYALEPDESNKIHWDHCREQFAPKFIETTTGFFFSHSNRDEDIAEFITKFENITGIERSKTNFPLSAFRKTCRKKVLWIEPSAFWLPCPMKRSLFTIITRCGLRYSSLEDNFDDALFGNYKENSYAVDTRHAVMRFMFGFTHWTSSLPFMASTVIKHGWREEFHKLDDSTLRRRLIRPEGETKETSIIGLESIWT